MSEALKTFIKEIVLDDDKVKEVETYLPPLDDFVTHEGWLLHGVKEGLYETAEVQQDGETIAYLFFSVGPVHDRVYCINAIRSLVRRDIMAAIYLAAIEHAKRRGCYAIEMTTRRAGLCEKSKKFGFEGVGVVLRKKI